MIHPSDVLVILAGPSASGKSTYATSFLAANPGFALISPDLMREELTGDMANQSKNRFIFETLLPIRINGLRALAKGGVIDATSTTKKARRLLLEYGRTAGFKRFECHVVWAPFKTCLARNAARERKVPLEVLARQHAQWQEPTLDEGFDEIKRVDTITLDRPSQVS